MFAVERLGSYISRGVYTVSGPFHPFGGAVDIVVVEQPDGSFKSCPWYVRFGKFQGVLKASEKVVSINVNGVDADFHMYLDHKGEAFFLREVDALEDDSQPYPSSGDEVDLNSDHWKTQKSKSCNYDVNGMDLVSELEASNGKILARTTTRQRRVFGLAFGRRSMKENRFQDEEGANEVDRVSSLERAEIAADLLEVKWTTNLATTKDWNSNALQASNRKSQVASNVPGHEQSISSTEEIDVELPCSTNPGNYVETFTLEETYMGVDPSSNASEISNKVVNGVIHTDTNASKDFSEDSKSVRKTSRSLDAEQNEVSVSSSADHPSTGNVSQGGSITEIGGGIDGGLMSRDNNTIPLSENRSGHGNGSLNIADENSNKPKEQLPEISSEAVLTIPSSDMDEKEDNLDNLASCNGDNKNLWNTTEAQLRDDVPSDQEVFPNEVINLENSTIIESCNSVSCSINKLSSEDVFTGTSDLNSLPPVSDKGSSSLGAEEGLGNSAQERNFDFTQSENSEDEQFSFSDLGHPKVENIEHIEASSPDSGKECVLRDSLESSEDEVTETIITDKESLPVIDKLIEDDFLINQPSPKVLSNRLSSPISITKVLEDDEEVSLIPVVESLPNLLFNGDDLVSHGVPQPLSRSLDSNLEALKIANSDVPLSSEMGIEQQVQLTAERSQLSEEIKTIISDPAVEVSLCRHLLYEGMGYEAAALAFDAEKLDMEKFSSLSPDIVKNDKLVVRIGGLYFPWDAAVPIASAIGSEGREQIMEPKGMIAVGQVDKTSEEVAQKSMNTRNGSWKLWPFSFKRSNSVKGTKFDSETSSESPIGKVENLDIVEHKVKKKKIKAKAPTSEQLASLNLKEGKNVVTFTFSTAMLGKQQVDARIFLWKWNTRIVISDVDGTITKSDVLGQFMPLMGIDWSQSGVTHLFSAIKENGYQLLFLSARSISQAYTTRQFLFNLKQDGKALPEGPVLISPDGLFPSLYREVIRRAPHEFKISCLEDVKALFPLDQNPFYAGFGNRDTDEISYLKVGIPIGKIFIINPKGEVAVNRRVDTKSYTSLHTLVHGMFPPTPVAEPEDYNSWNFWRLPPPDVGI